MSQIQQSQELAEKILTFQENFHLNDATLSLVSHLSVEKVHGIKVGKYAPSHEESELLLEFIQNYRNKEQ
ncbi:LBP_cg2779 family protein [Liquorilactobacillus satsumensis]|uniref:Uncharacterized protein n=1 Tax=Liquorilactobacillus satsumensis DSM 16230 = JCM 12392 TaxID=1423801 RepID=A0A0R1V8U4_9LACO|nr:LBP_cg2779 family protein [Liquorilactobacillus satsumensis]KRM00052.1 hypothetical protein FD50_GL002292 [Liquorilactobacillus satsumensis DSM 16230 = JCM 12392]MCC7667011.1 hypothetical protein [Liquorilactobacillus satsumensis]MCP9313313.1 hypothetical protein [Liquorilactobacillus satsumensis]MCP9329567.1 hypothetical protein [Liquorilactobacillus satsumensis]MCP9358148.1 hypothetical protein [Liquorilactobacillus satsumensis]